MNIVFKRIIKYISILAIAISVTGCGKDWMNAKGDKRQSTLSSIKDMQAILDNVYNLNTSTTPLAPEIASDGHYITEAVWSRYQGTNNQNRYTWTNSIVYESELDWNSTYYAVLLCNTVLREVEKFKEEPAYQYIKAQAVFFRSLCFLNLAITYAPAYNSSTAGKDLGIPLRLNDDVTEPSVRSSVQQTYQQITGDLLGTINGLPLTPPVITQPSRNAAFGLLARTYLYMGDYANAAKYADELLKTKKDLLDYNSIPDNKTFIGVNKEVIFLALFAAYSEVNSDYLISPELINLYDPNDRRSNVFFRSSSDAILFKGTYGNTSYDQFSGIALDEIYLIRAECYARDNNIPKAMETLNDLVRTRYTKNEDGSSTYVNQTATTKVEALRKIFLERRKQLILRNIRWADLKRLNLETDFATTITREIGGETYTLEPNSYKYNFPIPAEIIRASSMPQNPGWEK